MRTLLYTNLRFLLKVALHLYYKRILVEGLEQIPKNQPLILVANHQNALIDPLLVATHLPLRPYYLTRAAAFKNSFASFFLNLIQMLPVYRVRDGFSSLPQNQKTFQKTEQVLKENGAVLIFAEGNHSLVRNIRPLSKGFTRMAYGALTRYPEIKPLILPIGIQYSAHKKTAGIARITIGKAIAIDPDPTQALKLTKQVEQALKTLVVDIPDAEYPETLSNLLENQVDVTNKKEVELFLSGMATSYQVKTFGTLRNKLMKIFHLPLYWIWLFGIAPKMEDEVFTSTWKFLIGFVLAPMYYFLLALCCFHPEYGPWAISFLLMAWISLWANQNSQE
jgi:1-acyl-sn-glycerol-3-phosphate acyltransferase